MARRECGRRITLHYSACTGTRMVRSAQQIHERKRSMSGNDAHRCPRSRQRSQRRKYQADAPCIRTTAGGTAPCSRAGSARTQGTRQSANDAHKYGQDRAPRDEHNRWVLFSFMKNVLLFTRAHMWVQSLISAMPAEQSRRRRLGEGGRKREGGSQARRCLLVGLMQAVALALVCPASAHECDRARSRVARKILDVEVYNKVRTAPGRRPQDGTRRVASAPRQTPVPGRACSGAVPVASAFLSGTQRLFCSRATPNP